MVDQAPTVFHVSGLQIPATTECSRQHPHFPQQTRTELCAICCVYIYYYIRKEQKIKFYLKIVYKFYCASFELCVFGYLLFSGPEQQENGVHVSVIHSVCICTRDKHRSWNSSALHRVVVPKQEFRSRRKSSQREIIFSWLFSGGISTSTVCVLCEFLRLGDAEDLEWKTSSEISTRKAARCSTQGQYRWCFDVCSVGWNG